MNLDNFMFYDDNDPQYQKIFVRVIFWLNIFTIMFFLLVGVTTKDWQSIFGGLILVFWYILTFVIFKNRFKFERYLPYLYVPGIFILAIIEETIIYYNGGGLGGTATSLWHDLSLAVPIFVAMGVGIQILHKFRNLYVTEFYILGAIQGLIIEVIMKISLLQLVFVGGAMMIYGTMMSALSYNNNKERKRYNILINLVIGTIFIYIMVIIGAIIGDNIYN